MKKHLKIVTDGLHGKNVRVYGVQRDGEEVTVEDLTEALMITRISITLDVDTVNKATLHCFVDTVEIEAELGRIEREYSDEVPD